MPEKENKPNWAVPRKLLKMMSITFSSQQSGNYRSPYLRYVKYSRLWLVVVCMKKICC